MKRRNWLFPFVWNALLIAMMVFLSCAHKPESAGAEDSAMSEVELGSAIGENSQNKTSNATQDTANLDQDQVQGAQGNTAPGASAEQSEEAKLDEILEQEKAAEPAPTPIQEVAAAPSPEPTPIQEVAEAEPTPTPIVESAPRETTQHVSRVPVIPRKAFRKNGTWLNRYYFSRVQDNAAKVSELIYGNSARSADLKKWNRGSKFRPGGVVFYSSPVEPEDRVMRSLYQERNLTPETYTIKRGDWLSKVAKNKLGHPASWKELAVVNAIDAPDALKVGQPIAIFSSLDVPTQAAQNEQAAAAEPVAPPPQEAAPAPTPDMNPVAAATPEMPNAETAAVQPPQVGAEVPLPATPPQQPIAQAEPPSEPQSFSLENLNINKLVEQNLFSIAMGGLILLMLIALGSLRKKRLRQGEMDDSLPMPPKMKRR